MSGPVNLLGFQGESPVGKSPANDMNEDPE